MLRTTLGPLKDEMDRYILNFVNLNPGKNRLDVPCLDMSLRQFPGESLRVFNRKYRDISEQAYPVESRADDSNKLLIRNYLKSLLNKDIVRAVLRSSPASHAEAMITATEHDEVEDALCRLGHRHEEPMDVSPIQQQAVSSMAGLTKQIERLNTKFAKLETKIQQGGPRNHTRHNGNPNAWTADGKPICFTCNTPGHISRVCPRRTPQGSAQMDVSSTAPPTAGQGQGNC